MIKLIYLDRQIIFSNKMSSRICEMCEAYQALRESQLQEHIRDIDMMKIEYDLRSLKEVNAQLICERNVLMKNELFYFGYIFVFLVIIFFLSIK